MTGLCRISIGSNPSVEVEFEIEEDVTPSYLTEFIFSILNKKNGIENSEVNVTETKTEDDTIETKTNSNKVNIPNKTEIKEYIKGKPDYEHSSTEILEELCGFTFEKYSEALKNPSFRDTLDDVFEVCREIRSEIAEEENGRWDKKQKRLKGKYRHTYWFNRKPNEVSEIK